MGVCSNGVGQGMVVCLVASAYSCLKIEYKWRRLSSSGEKRREGSLQCPIDVTPLIVSRLNETTHTWRTERTCILPLKRHHAPSIAPLLTLTLTRAPMGEVSE